MTEHDDLLRRLRSGTADLPTVHVTPAQVRHAVRRRRKRRTATGAGAGVVAVVAVALLVPGALATAPPAPSDPAALGPASACTSDEGTAAPDAPLTDVELDAVSLRVFADIAPAAGDAEGVGVDEQQRLRVAVLRGDDDGEATCGRVRELLDEAGIDMPVAFSVVDEFGESGPQPLAPRDGWLPAATLAAYPYCREPVPDVVPAPAGSGELRVEAGLAAWGTRAGPPDSELPTDHTPVDGLVLARDSIWSIRLDLVNDTDEHLRSLVNHRAPHVALVRDGVVVGSIDTAVVLVPHWEVLTWAPGETVTITSRSSGVETCSFDREPLPGGDYEAYVTQVFDKQQPDGEPTRDGAQIVVGGPWTVTLEDEA